MKHVMPKCGGKKRQRPWEGQSSQGERVIQGSCSSSGQSNSSHRHDTGKHKERHDANIVLHNGRISSQVTANGNNGSQVKRGKTDNSNPQAFNQRHILDGRVALAVHQGKKVKKKWKNAESAAGELSGIAAVAEVASAAAEVTSVEVGETRKDRGYDTHGPMTMKQTDSSVASSSLSNYARRGGGRGGGGGGGGGTVVPATIKASFSSLPHTAGATAKKKKIKKKTKKQQKRTVELQSTPPPLSSSSQIAKTFPSHTGNAVRGSGTGSRTGSATATTTASSSASTATTTASSLQVETAIGKANPKPKKTIITAETLSPPPPQQSSFSTSTKNSGPNIASAAAAPPQAPPPPSRTTTQHDKDPSLVTFRQVFDKFSRDTIELYSWGGCNCCDCSCNEFSYATDHSVTCRCGHPPSLHPLVLNMTSSLSSSSSSSSSPSSNSLQQLFVRIRNARSVAFQCNHHHSSHFSRIDSYNGQPQADSHHPHYIDHSHYLHSIITTKALLEYLHAAKLLACSSSGQASRLLYDQLTIVSCLDHAIAQAVIELENCQQMQWSASSMSMKRKKQKLTTEGRESGDGGGGGGGGGGHETESQRICSQRARSVAIVSDLDTVYWLIYYTALTGGTASNGNANGGYAFTRHDVIEGIPPPHVYFSVLACSLPEAKSDVLAAAVFAQCGPLLQQTLQDEFDLDLEAQVEVKGEGEQKITQTRSTAIYPNSVIEEENDAAQRRRGGGSSGMVVGSSSWIHQPQKKQTEEQTDNHHQHHHHHHQDRHHQMKQSGHGRPDDLLRLPVFSNPLLAVLLASWLEMTVLWQVHTWWCEDGDVDNDTVNDGASRDDDDDEGDGSTNYCGDASHGRERDGESRTVGMPSAMELEPGSVEGTMSGCDPVLPPLLRTRCDSMRDWSARLMAFAVPNKRALIVIARHCSMSASTSTLTSTSSVFSPSPLISKQKAASSNQTMGVVEVGAGLGYWKWSLDHWISLTTFTGVTAMDMLAFDKDPPLTVFSAPSSVTTTVTSGKAGALTRKNGSGGKGGGGRKGEHKVGNTTRHRRQGGNHHAQSGQMNEYHGHAPGWSTVRAGGVETLMTSAVGGRYLLLCYPPPFGNMALQTLHKFKGDTIFYIGELKGDTGTAAFEKVLCEQWTLVEEVTLPCFINTASKLMVLKRKLTLKQPSSVSSFSVAAVTQQPPSPLLKCSVCKSHGKRLTRCRLTRAVEFCSSKCSGSKQGIAYHRVRLALRGMGVQGSKWKGLGWGNKKLFRSIS